MQKQYLSSASAFRLTSADKSTGLAYFGSESCCCFFSLNQASASTHSFKTYVTQKTQVGMEDIGGWEEIGGWGRAQQVHYLLFIRNINVFKFCISRHCSFSVTINTVTKLIDHSTPLCVLLVSLFNGVTLLQFDKSPSISNNQNQSNIIL